MPSDALTIEPLSRPPRATVQVPGSKSYTNRALVAAALGPGRSVLRGALMADDTDAMTDCLVALRVQVVADPDAATIEVQGIGGALPEGSFHLDARLSGTTSRFVLPVLATGPGHYRLDGAEPLRQRPMGPTLAAVRHLGASVDDNEHPGHLPVTVQGPVRGGRVEVPGDASSQFVSGLLLAGPAMPDGLTVAVTGALVSRPYVEMTVDVMRAFGARVDQPDADTFVVAPVPYRSVDYTIEPDATAATYFLAAAAITGGRVRVEGLGSASRQGDVAFADVLARMGADVTVEPDAIEVQGTGRLVGGHFDMSTMPDVAQTLAAVAVFAESPVSVGGVGFIRGHETDRITAVVTELQRLGVEARETDDGFVVEPGPTRPAEVQTYHDHRMAMSFALVGLRNPGVSIADPGCVAKTFPHYFEVLDDLRH